MLLNRSQQGDDAIDERLGTKDPDIRVGDRLRRKMLAAAEADLQPIGPMVGVKKLSRGAVLGCRRHGNGQFRQQIGNKRFLAAPQLPTGPPTMETLV
jgi:hypothetical protein